VPGHGLAGAGSVSSATGTGGTVTRLVSVLSTYFLVTFSLPGVPLGVPVP